MNKVNENLIKPALEVGRLTVSKLSKTSIGLIFLLVILSLISDLSKKGGLK